MCPAGIAVERSVETEAMAQAQQNKAVTGLRPNGERRGPRRRVLDISPNGRLPARRGTGRAVRQRRASLAAMGPPPEARAADGRGNSSEWRKTFFQGCPVRHDAALGGPGRRS